MTVPTSPNCTLSAAGSLRSLLGFSRSRPTAAKATIPALPKFPCGLASLQPRRVGRLECAAASAAQTKLRATKGAQLRLKTYVMRNARVLGSRMENVDLPPTSSEMCPLLPQSPGFFVNPFRHRGNFPLARIGLLSS